jgi:hypothetical protein
MEPENSLLYSKDTSSTLYSESDPSDSSRGVLPTVLRHCVWSRNLKNEKAKTRKWVVKASKRK